MNKGPVKLIRCDCMCCGITVDPVSERENNTLFILEVWTHLGMEDTRWWTRIKKAWRILRGYPVAHHDIVLTREGLDSIGRKND